MDIENFYTIYGDQEIIRQEREETKKNKVVVDEDFGQGDTTTRATAVLTGVLAAKGTLGKIKQKV